MTLAMCIVNEYNGNRKRDNAGDGRSGPGDVNGAQGHNENEVAGVDETHSHDDGEVKLDEQDAKREKE